jgi:hypothetical protein
MALGICRCPGSAGPRSLLGHCIPALVLAQWPMELPVLPAPPARWFGPAAALGAWELGGSFPKPPLGLVARWWIHPVSGGDGAYGQYRHLLEGARLCASSFAFPRHSAVSSSEPPPSPPSRGAGILMPRTGTENPVTRAWARSRAPPLACLVCLCIYRHHDIHQGALKEKKKERKSDAGTRVGQGALKIPKKRPRR